MMYHALGALGDCVVFNDDGSCAIEGPSLPPTDSVGGSAYGSSPGGGPVLSSASNAGITQSIYNQQFPTSPSGNPSTGFNWGSWFQGIFPTIAADATKIGQQAIASPGTVLLPNGTVAVGTAQGQAVLGIPGITSSTLNSFMPVLLIGGGLLVAVMVLKRR